MLLPLVCAGGAPVEFTRQLSPNWRTWTAGPSSGIQMRAGGPSPGRLVVCGWVIDEGLRRPAGYDPQGYTAGSAVIYSDDHGANWHSGGRIDVCWMLGLTNCTFGRKATDECQPVQLTNGSILVTLRSEWQGDGHKRSQARSDDGHPGQRQHRGIRSSWLLPAHVKRLGLRRPGQPISLPLDG
jgi:hypothetical protein